MLILLFTIANTSLGLALANARVSSDLKVLSKIYKNCVLRYAFYSRMKNSAFQFRHNVNLCVVPQFKLIKYRISYQKYRLGWDFLTEWSLWSYLFDALSLSYPVSLFRVILQSLLDSWTATAIASCQYDFLFVVLRKERLTCVKTAQALNFNIFVRVVQVFQQAEIGNKFLALCSDPSLNLLNSQKILSLSKSEDTALKYN